MTGLLVSLGIFLIGLAFGLRGSLRLTRRFRDTWTKLTGSDRLILFAFVVVAWTILAFAAYIGVMSLRRSLGFAPLDWAPFVGAVLAAVILFIPTFLDLVVERIARDR